MYQELRLLFTLRGQGSKGGREGDYLIWLWPRQDELMRSFSVCDQLAVNIYFGSFSINFCVIPKKKI